MTSETVSPRKKSIEKSTSSFLVLGLRLNELHVPALAFLPVFSAFLARQSTITWTPELTPSRTDNAVGVIEGTARPALNMVATGDGKGCHCNDAKEK